jgi:hypothetical protein
MVKRIKKRIDKSEQEEAAQALENESAEGQASGFSRELDEMADDGFTTALVSMVKTVTGHRGILIAGVVLSVGSFVGFNMMEDSRRGSAEEAASAFNVASAAYIKEIPTELVQSGLLSYTPGATEAKPDAPKDEAARKAALTKAAKDFKLTIDQYQASSVAKIAKLGRASIDFDLGKLAEAKTEYKAVVASADLSPMAKAMALQGQAATQESEGDSAGALASWQALEKADQAAYGLLAGLQVARIQEATGDAAAAVKTYTALKTAHAKTLADFRNAAKKAQIDRRLQALGAPSK